MAATQDDTTYVGTPTDYETSDINCEHPVGIYVGGLSNDAATYISQQLSLFVETHDDKALVRVMEVLSPAVESASEVVIDTGTPADVPSDCWWPVELEVEGINSGAATDIVEAFTELAADGFTDGSLANEFRTALIDATADQPRSIVRLVRNDGSRRDALEWHTDTEAELETT
ncbi:hypothetical protein [Haloarcula marismortui]|uniref:Uncharacterized protein n=1 Tax=Haloarcula marismortui ATCC 33799 TaxID=662475 RepID=M0JQH7_9EURY|nr:hypothetical protein [Haloarcula californiae]EMA09910.1 hypothetical protein C435_21100 [Haloarcula californiae ATCC 33799]